MSGMRKQWNDACLSVGIDSISPSKSAKIMAVLMHLDNNEAMVMNQHFIVDVYYIKERYNLDGGLIPDATFVEYFKEYEKAEKLFREDYEIKLWF